jgi:YaiO family outer membrane protein
VRRALAALAFVAVPALALDMEGGFTYENLDRGQPDWQSLYLEAAHDFAPRQTFYGQARETERFGFRDSELSAGYYHPLGPHWTGVVEASVSPDHNVLPQSAIFGQLSWQFAQGWVASGGARYNSYTDNDARTLNLGLERYFSSYRAFYALYNGKPQGGPSASAQRLGLELLYCGERCRAGAAVTWGREVEYVGPPTGIITSDVRAFGVFGRHWLAPSWAMTWDLGTHEQGDLYRRTGVRLGLRHHF